jgi:hypothetical protein
VKLKANGKGEHWITFVSKALTHLSEHVQLDNSEAVKQFIANKNGSTGYKKNLCTAYNTYCQHYEIEWTKPLYKQTRKPIRIPTKEKLEKLISSAGFILSIKLHLSKETGGEQMDLENMCFLT